jgi:hypothetical protein
MEPPLSSCLPFSFSTELEWCGGHSYLFMASRYIDSSTRAKDLEIRCENAEAGYIAEQSNASSLRKQLKSSQMLAEDSEWQLQEQLAHSNNMLSLEQQNVAELMNKVTELSHKLTEVEMYLDSDRGRITMQMEEELAETKLKLAELEAERDEHEIEKNGLSSFNMNKLNLPLNRNSQSQKYDVAREKHSSSSFDENENEYNRNRSLIYTDE